MALRGVNSTPLQMALKAEHGGSSLEGRGAEGRGEERGGEGREEGRGGEGRGEKDTWHYCICHHMNTPHRAALLGEGGQL